MNSYSAIYCISAISQNNVRLSDIFQITTLILIMCIVFLHWTIRTQNRTAVHDKFSWFPVWCPCISLIQFQPEAFANTVVQCKPFKHRSDWVTPRAGPQAEDHASTPLPLLCSSAVPCVSRRTKFASRHCSGHGDLPWHPVQYGREPHCAPALLPLHTHR